MVRFDTLQDHEFRRDEWAAQEAQSRNLPDCDCGRRVDPERGCVGCNLHPLDCSCLPLAECEGCYKVPCECLPDDYPCDPE